MPLEVNAKQYHRILKRRRARQRLEGLLTSKREAILYLHRDRCGLATRRPRGPGGRCLTFEELMETERRALSRRNNGKELPPKAANTSVPLLCNTGNSEVSKCINCGGVEDLWICLTCDNIGCGDLKGGHAKQHWRESGHKVVQMVVGRSTIWDYSTNSWNRPSDIPSPKCLDSEPPPSTDQLGLTPCEVPLSQKRLYPFDTDVEQEPATNVAKRVKVIHTSTFEALTSVSDVAYENTSQADASFNTSGEQDTRDSNTMMTDHGSDEARDHTTSSHPFPAPSQRPHQLPNGHFKCPQCDRQSGRLSEIK